MTSLARKSSGVHSFILRMFILLRGAGYSIGFFWLWTWIAMSVQPFDRHFAVSLPMWLRFAGLAIALPGAILVGVCIALFCTVGRGTPAPWDPPREFVATGPYRYVRNPMYVGADAVILGAGVALSSVSIVILAGAFLAIMHCFVLVIEEPSLLRKFGASYQRYRKEVHRWLIRNPQLRPAQTFAAGPPPADLD